MACLVLSLLKNIPSSPEYFNRSWKSKIIPEASASWRLKLSNLKKIVKAMDDHYNEILHVSLAKLAKPDVQQIGTFTFTRATSHT